MSGATAALHALPRPVAWVFTSGLARCAAQVGMAEVLLEQGLRPDLLAGSSFGALNAAALTEREPDPGPLRQVWRRMGTDSVLDNLSSAVVRGFAPRRTGKSARELAEIMADAIPGGSHAMVPENLLTVASDLVSGRPVTITQGRTLDAVAISSTLPIIFNPVQRDGALLVDGSLLAIAPLEQALAAGAGSVIVFDTAWTAVSEESLAEYRWWQVAALSYSHQIRAQMGHSLARLGARIPVAIVPIGNSSLFDFDDPDPRFSEGRSAAATALASDLVDLDPNTPGVYGHRPDPSEG